jgi:hypothetical protein
MADNFEAIPPPYSSYDPLTSSHSNGSEIVHPTQTYNPPVHEDSRGISFNGYTLEEDEACQMSSVHSVEGHLEPQHQLGHGLTSHTVCPSANSSSKAMNHDDLSTLSESMVDMKLCSPSAVTSELQNKHPTAGISLHDIKTNLLVRLTSSTPSSHLLSKPERRALKSDLRALKHEIRAVVRQVKSEQRDEANAKGGGRRCCKAPSCHEKWELRRWKRESLKEIREVKRAVRRAGRKCP